jgi:hypothetical protein
MRRVGAACAPVSHPVAARVRTVASTRALLLFVWHEGFPNITPGSCACTTAQGPPNFCGFSGVEGTAATAKGRQYGTVMRISQWRSSGARREEARLGDVMCDVGDWIAPHVSGPDSQQPRAPHATLAGVQTGTGVEGAEIISFEWVAPFETAFEFRRRIQSVCACVPNICLGA